MALDESEAKKRFTNNGGQGADFIAYTVNAPVTIEGGGGTDTVVVGTEFGDDFVVTARCIWSRSFWRSGD